MMRPAILRSDFNLRLFIDTNVLIDYLENFDSNDAKRFIEIFKSSDFENIELVTSDYVLWELYDYFRKDLYVKKMITEEKWGFNRARQGIEKFKGVNKEVMKGFGNEIITLVDQLRKNGTEDFVNIQYLMNEKTENFSEIIEMLLRSSKISYKDTMIFTSAFYTHSHILITIDKQFNGEGNRINDLEEVKKRNFPKEFYLKFKPPSCFSSEQNIKSNYKDWFEEYNNEKKIGSVFHCYNRVNVICVECCDDYVIKVGDYIWAVKFSETKEIIKNQIEIKEDCLKDYETGKPISEGKKVTIKLSDTVLRASYLENASIFLAQE